MNDGADFAIWVARFEAEAVRRRADGDPGWGRGACLHRSVLASIQRFQVGESGDGADLIAKADEVGDDAYSAAVRLFVGEEQKVIALRYYRALRDGAGDPLAADVAARILADEERQCSAR
ncbi:hypothetical protein [Nonomuraea sp. NEAU-A123]|uniref:hypothetical protein n=1 Tax=Nonomuraea sp. NEAU-A123 TaxID=2839649 RepID=UPI0020328955|nr:hypothetical protein [Nonomuraea sp. NEAU-A123]